MVGTKVWLNRYGPAKADGLVWVWRFPDEDYYSLRAANGAWELSRNTEEGAAVTVNATQAAWATFLTAPAEKRQLPSDDVRLEGTQSEIRKFTKAFKARLAAR